MTCHAVASSWLRNHTVDELFDLFDRDADGKIDQSSFEQAIRQFHGHARSALATASAPSAPGQRCRDILAQGDVHVHLWSVGSRAKTGQDLLKEVAAHKRRRPAQACASLRKPAQPCSLPEASTFTSFGERRKSPLAVDIAILLICNVVRARL